MLLRFFAWAWLYPCAVSCGYRTGYPAESAIQGVDFQREGWGLAVGDVVAPVVEPGVADALRQATAAAIRRHGAGGGRAVHMDVRLARFEPAVGGFGQVAAWEAELAVGFTLLGPEPRTLELQRVISVAGTGAEATGLASLRAEAFEALAVSLAEEAVAWFLAAPPEL